MLAVGVLATARTPATAQTLPWDVFPDDDAFGNRISASNCGLINAENAELVVESASGRLIIVSSADVALDDSTVDFDRFVFFQDLPFGMISFAEDADGFRTLWWVTLNGLVIHVDPLTGEPSVSNSLPSDFSNVPCNACPFWDDPTVCDEPAAPPPIDEPVTITLCGVTTPLTLALMVAGLMMMGLVRRRAV